MTEIPVYVYQTKLPDGSLIWTATSYTASPNATLLLNEELYANNDQQCPTED